VRPEGSGKLKKFIHLIGSGLKKVRTRVSKNRSKIQVVLALKDAGLTGVLHGNG
jgi:hypothetical protein